MCVFSTLSARTLQVVRRCWSSFCTGFQVYRTARLFSPPTGSWVGVLELSDGGGQRASSTTSSSSTSLCSFSYRDRVRSRIELCEDDGDRIIGCPCPPCCFTTGRTTDIASFFPELHGPMMFVEYNSPSIGLIVSLDIALVLFFLIDNQSKETLSWEAAGFGLLACTACLRNCAGLGGVFACIGAVGGNGVGLGGSGVLVQVLQCPPNPK